MGEIRSIGFDGVQENLELVSGVSLTLEQRVEKNLVKELGLPLDQDPYSFLASLEDLERVKVLLPKDLTKFEKEIVLFSVLEKSKEDMTKLHEHATGHSYEILFVFTEKGIFKNKKTEIILKLGDYRVTRNSAEENGILIGVGSSKSKLYYKAIFPYIFGNLDDKRIDRIPIFKDLTHYVMALVIQGTDIPGALAEAANQYKALFNIQTDFKVERVYTY